MGAIIAGAISMVVGWGIKKLSASTFTAVVCTGLFMAAMTLLPFSIAMPSSMYDILLKGSIGKIFGMVGWLVPLSDILICTCFIILCRYSGVLFNLAMKFFNWIAKTVGSGQ